MLQEGATELLCLRAGGGQDVYLCDALEHSDPEGWADSKTPQGEEEWREGGRGGLGKKWEKDDKEGERIEEVEETLPCRRDGYYHSLK